MPQVLAIDVRDVVFQPREVVELAELVWIDIPEIAD